jgi:predicted amidohydrolase
MTASSDAGENLQQVSVLIREAASGGATFIATPEVTNLMEPRRKLLFEKIFVEPQDPTLAGLRTLAAELEIHLLIGSLVLDGGEGKAVNRSFLLRPDGTIAARYDKIHLFDVMLPDGHSYRESKAYRAGDRAVLAALPGMSLGLTICYDLRFPKLYNDLARCGADLLTVPSAFTKVSGQAHWHVLLRARAIETGSFVLAPAQCGVHEGGRETYGHSLVVSPWGEVLADAGEEPGVVWADLDPAEVAIARARIPALSHLRPFAAPQAT